MSEAANAPDRIWAWVYADPWGNELRWFEWENHEPESGDAEYIRADLVQAKDAEIARLTADLEAMTALKRSYAELKDAAETERDELRAAIFGGPNYSPRLQNGNFVEMVTALHAAQQGGLARAEKAEAERDAALAKIGGDA